MYVCMHLWISIQGETKYFKEQHLNILFYFFACLCHHDITFGSFVKRKTKGHVIALCDAIFQFQQVYCIEEKNIYGMQYTGETLRAVY